MQKIINRPDRFVVEMLEGLLLAHPTALRMPEYGVVVRASAPGAGKVAVATGGGSGHLPVFVGYVGDGLADGCAVGEVFASPSAERMLEVTRQIDGGSGVLYLYGNYSGDRMNFDLAAELAAQEGIPVETVLAADDVASAPRSHEDRRRGIGGIFFLYKVAGARAAEGASLPEVADVTRRAARNVRSMAVALTACTIPAAGRPTFELPVGEMEIGMGLHGEPGVRRGPLESADAIAVELTHAIVGDLDIVAAERVAVLVNGLGATPKEELYILFRQVHKTLVDAGISVHRAYVGEYATSLEMAGASVSVLRLDDELIRLLDAPARSPFFMQ